MWPSIWTENRPKVIQKCVLEAPWKKTWKKYFLRLKIYHLRPWEYSKNDRVLFKITLLAYSQRGQKNDPETSHFGEVFGIKIVPRSIKSRFEIVVKKHVCLFWFCFDLGFMLDPWATLKSNIFWVFQLLLSLLRHLGAKRVAKVLQDSPRGRFFMIWDRFGNDFGANFNNFPSPF